MLARRHDSTRRLADQGEVHLTLARILARTVARTLALTLTSRWG